MPPSTERLQQIALMYAADNGELHRLVERRGSPEHATVEDACAFAWTRLLTAEQVDLRAPRCHALAWLTTVAVHEAWRLNAIARRAGAVDPDMVDAISIGRERAVPCTHDVAAQHLRLDLVAQIPERPRRFLLRLALGYSYNEISLAEGVSHTTTNRQIARAKHILRDLDANANATATEKPVGQHAARVSPVLFARPTAC
jgi:DNA-directed RNA polymerase specialized sigma24 family protein